MSISHLHSRGGGFLFEVFVAKNLDDFSRLWCNRTDRGYIRRKRKFCATLCRRPYVTTPTSRRPKRWCSFQTQRIKLPEDSGALSTKESVHQWMLPDANGSKWRDNFPRGSTIESLPIFWTILMLTIATMSYKQFLLRIYLKHEAKAKCESTRA